MSSGDSSSAMAGLAALFASLSGPEAFLDVREALDAEVYTPMVPGYFRSEAIFFIVIHALITISSMIGLFVRGMKGNLWFFSVRNQLYFPNTSVNTQLCFMGYSILYIVSITTTEMKQATTSAYGVSVAAYVFLGLAIHLQAWATIYAKPRGSYTLSTSQPVSASRQIGSRFLRRVGPKTMNAIMIVIGSLFVLTIIIGRVVSSVPRKEMMGALGEIDAALMEAARTNATPQSLIALLPTFEIFITKGQQLGSMEHTILKVWILWAVVWFLMYIPPAISLLRTLIAQQQQLLRTFSNLDALDAIQTTGPVSPPPAALQRSPSSDTLTRGFTPAFARPSSASSMNDSKASSFVSVNVKTPIPSRTAPQKYEIEQKLNAVRKMKGIIATQLATTTLMLVVYSAIAIFELLPWTQRQSSELITHVSNTWLGWAFIIPGTFSSAFFLHASIRASRALPLSRPASPNSAEVTADLDDWRSPKSVSFAGTNSATPELEMGEARTSSVMERASMGEEREELKSSWVPSKWVREREDSVEGLKGEH
ncbi:hypothetical protein RQP46_004318 [Phenoliferia psychrophenolica]